MLSFRQKLWHYPPQSQRGRSFCSIRSSKVVGHRTHKHTLCEITDFRCRDKAVHLCGDRGGFVIAVDGHRLPLLENLSKSLRKGLGGFSHDLTTEHVAYGIFVSLYFLCPHNRE